MSEGNNTKKQRSLEPNGSEKGPGFCPHCGAALSGGERFCPECGQAILGKAATTAKAPVVTGPPANKQVSIDDVINKAAEFRDKKEYEKALKLLLDAIPSYPDSSKLFNNIGFTYRMAGNSDKAIEYYKKALEIESKPIYYSNMARAYQYRGSDYDALYYIQEALKRIQLEQNGYNRGIIYSNYALIIGKLGDLHGARKALVTAEKEGYPKEDCEGIWIRLLRS